MCSQSLTVLGEPSEHPSGVVHRKTNVQAKWKLRNTYKYKLIYEKYSFNEINDYEND